MTHPNITGKSSGILTADTLVRTGPTRVHAITIMWGTAAQHDLRLYDGGTGGTLRWQAKHAAVAAVGDITDHYVFPTGIMFSTSLHLEYQVGADALVVIVYDEVG